MAAASLLALIDDVASILDDVAAMSKIAAKKTAGVLGDDLALNAQQVSGVNADRELPVVWAVAKGSLRNKAILVPAALVISALIPWAVMPLLMLGGAYLCYEGVEKVAHGLIHRNPEEHTTTEADEAPASEADKIRGAIRTDFILSAEIIVIALGTVAEAPLMQRLAVLVAVAVLMTIGVYGFVAAIVKLDDGGLYLSRRASPLAQRLGLAMLWLAPCLMKTLSVAGTVAMFLVGGGIVLHGLPWAHHLGRELDSGLQSLPNLAVVVSPLLPSLLNMVGGVLTGVVVLASASLLGRLRKAFKWG